MIRLTTKRDTSTERGLVFVDLNVDDTLVRLVLSAAQARCLASDLQEHAGVADLDSEETNAELKEGEA